MGRPHRFLRLTAQQDNELRGIEQNPLLREKVRMRARIIRLSHQGFSLEQLAQHFGRNVETISQDLGRFEQHGINGLGDGQAPGQPAKITDEMVTFVQHKLAEQRVWNCELLSEAIKQQFQVTIQREAIRVKLHKLGYSWKRGRYSPTKAPDPAVVEAHDASIKTLKKGLWTANSP
ncbi:helix-turn-helix domain-containing protein [Deinococcus peraridilitoris]|uniref:Transposase n=1 Tax=Deinococcus peraridilitoris (strain DSM 19664 / LMG 22246 / CIP 109416 / KR-200) TaxID=937777 RepID=L0A002_DEIPD|nr:helix-turn-helix domain-containing protein [Deinococcus peraridilitoris]AFZ67208.1 transposase [Deinococcus peraridilitoris DSM 19664]